MGSNTIRAFIAFKLNTDIQQVVRHIQDRLMKLDCNIKWVTPENIHLTLKFLGDVKLKNIGSIQQILRETFSGIPPIETQLTDLGAFPDIDYPQVLWVGLDDDRRQLAGTAKTLEKALGKAGIKKSGKPFSPHITIGRVRSPRNIASLSQAMTQYTLPDVPKQIFDEVMLFKSTLTPQGPVYERLENIGLH